VGGRDRIENYRDAIDAWNRRDLVWILEQATPDFEFHTSGIFEGVEAVYRGREGMVQFWTTFIEEPWALFRLEIDEIEGIGEECVLALMTFHGTEREGNEEVTHSYAHLARFRGEEIARIDAFTEWDEARRAAAAG
jgi:hypothetical protein